MRASSHEVEKASKWVICIVLISSRTLPQFELAVQVDHEYCRAHKALENGSTPNLFYTSVMAHLQSFKETLEGTFICGLRRRYAASVYKNITTVSPCFQSLCYAELNKAKLISSWFQLRDTTC